MTDNIWISIIIWLLDLLSVIITAHYQFLKSLFPPFFVWYLWQPNIRLCTWSAKVWHVYDRAGTWSSRGQNSRSTYSVSPLRSTLKFHKFCILYLLKYIFAPLLYKWPLQFQHFQEFQEYFQTNIYQNYVQEHVNDQRKRDSTLVHLFIIMNVTDSKNNFLYLKCPPMKK